MGFGYLWVDIMLRMGARLIDCGTLFPFWVVLGLPKLLISARRPDGLSSSCIHMMVVSPGR